MPVKLNIPASAFDTGVAFDPSPYVNYYLQNQARKKAKEEALIKSFNDLGSKLTPAGMNGDDIPYFMEKKKEWIDFVTTNEKAYKNPSIDNGVTYGEAMKRYNDVLGVIQTSKDKVEGLKSFAPVALDPKKHGLVTDETTELYRRGNLAINHPEYRPFSINDVKFNEKPFDDNQLKAFTLTMKGSIDRAIKNQKQYGQPVVDAATNTKIVPFSVQLTDEDKNGIAAQAGAWVASSPSFANYLDDILEDHGANFNQLNDVYKGHFGQDKNITTKYELATALALSQVSPELKGEENKGYTDVLGNFNIMQDRRYEDFVKRYNYTTTHPRTTEKPATILSTDQYIANLGANAQPIEYLKKDGTKEVRYLVSPDPKVYASLAGSDGIKPDQVHMLPDGSVIPIFYKYKKVGNEYVAEGDAITGHYAVDVQKSQPIAASEFRNRVAIKLFGQKEAKQAAQGGNTTKPANNQPKKQYKGVPAGGF